MNDYAAAYLAKSCDLLDQARIMLDAQLHDAAGRTAYLAAFNAAHALIASCRDRNPRTHGGTAKLFLEIARDDPRIDEGMRTFLSTSYRLKSIADYELGADAHVSQAQASAALQGARRFVASVEAIIAHDFG